jgi:hypothetical protein
VKLGRKRPVARGLRLHLKDYIGAALPVPPPATDYSTEGMPSLSQVFLNDQLGDCVIAAGYHVVGLETGNAGSIFVPTPEQLLADYGAIGGYIPGNPGTDQGCDEETALSYWSRNGFADGSKLAGFLSLDPTNQTELMQALFLFENVFFGVELPDAWINPFPSSNGFVWDVGAPNPSNGHAFMGVGYNAQGILIDSWGLIGLVTWAAVAALCADPDGGQLFVLLSPDQIAKASAKSPAGFDWATLQADFASLQPR